MTGDRERLRVTFDAAADLYQRARPEYPPELFDELADLTALRPGARLLEIGCATGKATRPLAERGFRITALEIGAELAVAARRNLAGFPDVEVVHTSFEEWPLPSGPGFDLVYAATAWRWLDPAIRCRKVWNALRPRGHLAVWGAGHVFPDDGDPFFRDIQEVYDEIGEGLPPGSDWWRPGEQPGDAEEIEASGLFGPVATRSFDWELVYDAESYIDLLNTFSGHIAMEPWQRERLYGEIRRRLATRPEGTLRRHWGAILEVAARRSR